MSSLRLITDEEIEVAPVPEPEPKKGKERDSKALQNDFLYWKTRAERRELVGTWIVTLECGHVVTRYAGNGAPHWWPMNCPQCEQETKP